MTRAIIDERDALRRTVSRPDARIRELEARAEKAERLADREATGFRAMCEALERLEEIVGLDTGGGMGPGPALNAVEHIIRQRDALAAQVERLGNLCLRAQDRIALHGMSYPLVEEITETLESNPATSLARRDARMRAEGGESALVQVAVEMRQNNDRGSKADLYGLARHIEECARACRHQAEEAT